MSETIVLSNNDILYARAKKVLPGGVNSPVRACLAVEGEPLFIKNADGAFVFDVDGNSYIDYVGSFGPHILGHKHPRVLEALESGLRHGTSYGACCKAEVELAEFIVKAMPSIEMIRMVSSGTEAVMSAIRLARGFTKRSRILKFDGCYHGHVDGLLVKAGSGLATLNLPSSEGVPEATTSLTTSLPFNDVNAFNKFMKESGKEIACVIVEPIMGNCGVVLPKIEFLQGLREACNKYGALLIFDEVMTGFRVAKGGAQELYGIKADLTCLGKVIGGGLPIGAFGGRKEIMEMLAPLGPVYQAGTLSGNPLSMAAGLAQLKVMSQENLYENLKLKTEKFAKDLESIIKAGSHSIKINHVTGMLTIFFSNKDVVDYNTAIKCNTAMFGCLWRNLKEKNVFWPPSQFEAAFISIAHSDKDIDDTISIFESSLKSLNTN